MLKRVLIATGILVVLVVIGVSVLIGPRFIIGILTYGRQAREGSLKVGDTAPVVSLVDLDGATERGLNEWIGEKPLVLVFGSFT